MKVRVGVGETMGKVDLVFIMLKTMGESEGVVVSCESYIFLFVIVLVIRDIGPYTMPSQILFLL